jgi:hypothetical protein
MPPVGGEAVELDPREADDGPGELLDLADLGHRDAAAVHPRVQVDLQVDGGVGGGGGLGGLPGGGLVVAVDGQPHAAGGHGRQPAPLLRAQHRVGDADVVDAGGHERLGLARLGADDPPGAGRHLPAGDVGDLVGLDMRPEPDLVTVHERLPVGDVAFQPVEVAQDRRGVEVADGLARNRPRLRVRPGRERCQRGPPG